MTRRSEASRANKLARAVQKKAEKQGKRLACGAFAPSRLYVNRQVYEDLKEVMGWPDLRLGPEPEPPEWKGPLWP